ncbi:MAG TPA: hypothetical protein VH476_08130 [Solirubrobacterales bacterium]|jgi:hypothetical protein
MATKIPTASISHQNVRLAHGRHSTPEQGACVVELASMLAGERFSDHPQSVCPVIAAYLRNVNDHMPAGDLPGLFPVAAAIVGTGGSPKQSRSRARRCARWAADLGAGRHAIFLWPGRRWGWGGSRLGAICAQAAIGRGGPDLALSLLDAFLPAPADRIAAPVAAA